MDFKPIIEKLQELAGRQQRAGIDPTGEGRQVKGEGNPGLISKREPAHVMNRPGLNVVSPCDKLGLD